MNGAENSTIYVVDDDISIRESLSSLLRAEGFSVVVFSSADEFLALPLLAPRSCLLLDVRMPNIDGLALQDMLNALGREVPIIFITGHGDIPQAVRAMKAGAVDFLKKPFSDTELLQAVLGALALQGSQAETQVPLSTLKARFDLLTPREKEVMFEAVKGKKNKVIAHDLGVSESTVKVHRHNVMSKMHLRSLPELALALLRLKQKQVH